jgi:hypothetical protein
MDGVVPLFVKRRYRYVAYKFVDLTVCALLVSNYSFLLGITLRTSLGRLLYFCTID